MKPGWSKFLRLLKHQGVKGRPLNFGSNLISDLYYHTIKLYFMNTAHVAVHQLIPTIIVWILCTSPEVRKVDAACQVHVWHVSRGYTIISSSSLSEFIVLNFCPSLNMRWKHGIQLRLVNGSLSDGICGLFFFLRVFSLQITNRLFPCLARQQLVEVSKIKWRA